jgi:uncharacterized RDD family membrane protein YckC
VLDSIVSVETPEGVELDLRLAGPMPRILAWAIDTAVRISVYLLLASFLGTLGNFGMGILLITVFVLEWFYPVLFEIFWDGATLGKRALGVQVLHDDGTPVALSASMVRNLLRFVDFLPLLYGFGFVSMMLDHQFRRLGDLAAGTIVVYATREVARAARPDTTALAPGVVLTRAEQRAVMEFAERAPRLAPQRAQELAALAQPLTEQASDKVEQLYGVANYLAGAS